MISKIKGNIIKVIQQLEFESVSENNDFLNLMKTNFGKDFITKYAKLERFVSFASLMPSAFGIAPGIFEILAKDFTKLMNSLQFLQELDVEKANIDKLAPTLGLVAGQFMSRIREMNENQKKGIVKHSDEEINLSEIGPRIFDYYVLTFTAYVEVYVKELKKYLVLNAKEGKQIDSLPDRGSSKEQLKEILQEIGIGGENLNTIFNQILKELKKEYSGQSLAELINIRNRVAHGETLTTDERIKEMFSKEYNKALEEKEKVLKKWEKNKAPKELLDTMKPTSDDIKSVKLFRELGKLCIEYLSCLDHLICEAYHKM